jgi:hypothetical protein
MMLAIGSLLDLEAPPNSYDANHYYQLGRAALSVDSIFEEQSIPAIQALACDLACTGSKVLTLSIVIDVSLYVPLRYRWPSLGAYGPGCKVGAQRKHPPSPHNPYCHADSPWFSAVFVRCSTYDSHATGMADCISQTGIAVNGI